jgi:hypothetical protein
VHFAMKNKFKLNLYTLLKKHIKERRNISTHFLSHRPAPPPLAISPFCLQCAGHLGYWLRQNSDGIGDSNAFSPLHTIMFAYLQVYSTYDSVPVIHWCIKSILLFLKSNCQKETTNTTHNFLKELNASAPAYKRLTLHTW